MSEHSNIAEINKMNDEINLLGHEMNEYKVVWNEKISASEDTELIGKFLLAWGKINQMRLNHLRQNCENIRSVLEGIPQEDAGEFQTSLKTYETEIEIHLQSQDFLKSVAEKYL